jgi:hypothetical protein
LVISGQGSRPSLNLMLIIFCCKRLTKPPKTTPKCSS